MSCGFYSRLLCSPGAAASDFSVTSLAPGVVPPDGDDLNGDKLGIGGEQKWPVTFVVPLCNLLFLYD